MRVETCPRCKKTHASVSVTHTTDSKGRPRIKWTCPTTGHKVNWFAPKDTATKSTKARRKATPSKSTARKRTTSKGGSVPRKTTTTGTTPKSMRVSIPLTLDPEPSMAAAWDIAEGIVDGLAQLQNDDAGIQQEARAAYQEAKGIKEESDRVEYQFGLAMAKAIQLVCVQRGYTATAWRALQPPGLGGTRDYLGGGLIDYAVGAEGESGAMGIAGDLLENVVGMGIEAITGEGEFGDLLSEQGAPIIADGLRDLGKSAAIQTLLPGLGG